MQRQMDIITDRVKQLSPSLWSVTDLGDMAEGAASDGAEFLLRHDALQALVNGRQ